MPADPSDDCFRGYTGRAARVGVSIVRADLNPVKVRAKWRIITLNQLLATELAIGGARGERWTSEVSGRYPTPMLASSRLVNTDNDVG